MITAAFYLKSSGALDRVLAAIDEAGIALNAPAALNDYARFDDVAAPFSKSAQLSGSEWILVDKIASLSEAKVRRRRELQVEGITRIKTRFPAINNFDELRLVQQLVTSIAPAARQPTTDIAWLGQMWTAGSNAAAAVNAATTIAQVDAVTAAWPAL
jgi:hypothetical protein